MEKVKAYNIIGLTLLLSIVFFIAKSNKNEGWDKVIKHIENDEYYSRVSNKYIDTNNHNTPIIEFSTGKKTALYGQQWDLITVGDSLSKRKNSSIIEVFKRDAVLTIDQKAYILSLQKKEED